MAKTPKLTAIQLAGLLAPYKRKWMAIQGVVDDVDRLVGTSSVKVMLSRVNGDEHRKATAYFDEDQGRASALYRGANVHVLGKIYSIYGSETLESITLDACELTD